MSRNSLHLPESGEATCRHRVRRFVRPAINLFLLLLFFLCAAANAANIQIDDSNPDGSIKIAWVDFEGGFTVNGASNGRAGSLTLKPTLTNPQLTFTGTWITNGGSPGETVLYFVDQGTNHIRDRLTMSWSRACADCMATIIGTFQSDLPTDLGTAPSGSTQIQLAGSPQELVGNAYFPVYQNLTFQVVGKVAVRPGLLGGTGTSSNPAGGTSTTVNGTTFQGVNTATGNTYVRFSDLQVPGKGLRFGFVRFYNAQDTYSGPLCRGWTHSYNILLIPDPTSGAVTIKEGDGHGNVFLPGSNQGSYTAPPGVYDVLTAQGGNNYRLTRPDQTVLTFGLISSTPPVIRLLSITDKDLNTQSLSYDVNGNLVSFTDVGGGVYNFAYDASNHLTLLNDTVLHRSYQYGCDRTNLRTYTDAAGSVSSFSYDSNSLLTTAVDARLNTAISNTFDSKGRMLVKNRGTDALTCPTTYSYDDANRITTITDARNAVTRHYYDTSQRLIKIVNALGFTTNFTYDSNNNLASLTNGLQKTTNYTYDERGNRTKVVDPLGNTTVFTYDLANNLTSQTDANGNTTRFVYNAHGDLISVTDATGGGTSYGYDHHGNRTTFANANHQNSTSTFDGANRMVSMTDPASQTILYVYDAGGRLVNQTEPLGNHKILAYDNLGRLASISYNVTAAPSLQSVDPVTYMYDANGNRISTVQGVSEGTILTSATKAAPVSGTTPPQKTTTYVRDVLNRITSITFPDGNTVSYTYDCNDNRLSITFAGRTLNYTYDPLNRLTSVKDGAKLVATYTYDAADNPLRVSYQNGAAVTYTYDAANRITSVSNTYTGSTGNPVSNFSYVLDKVGNRVRVTDGAGSVTAYTYDKLYRLTGTTVVQKATSYTYDGVGNRLSQVAPATSIRYTYDAADKLTSAGQTAYIYDSNGNQISQKTGSTAITYQYDAADRLVEIKGGSVASSFTYDADGNRIRQTVGTSTYNYLNDIATDFATVLDETAPDGHIQYIRGRGLISANGPSFTNYYQYDAQSTVVGLTDTTGHLAQRYVYDVWGQLQHTVPAPKIGTQNKFHYTGEALDPGSSLYYLRARYYDPSLGRFISKDRVWGYERNPQTLNRFVYVRNNPATLTDRTGLWCDECTDDYNWLEWPGGIPLP